MMQNISRKMANVAELPLKLNLQLFAEEGYPSLEESSEFKDDAKEFNAKMDKFVQEREAKTEPVKEPETPAEIKTEPAKESEPAATPEVATPADKPKQDSETNKAFQEMRKQLEAEQARAKKADDLIAKQWGHLGITTVEQYEKAEQAEREAEDNKRYQEAGLTPEEIQKLKDYDRIQAETAQQAQIRTQTDNEQRWKQLYDVYPEVEEAIRKFNVGEPQDIFNAEMQVELSRGASPLAAYRNAHFETILQKTLNGVKETATQEAMDKLNSKDHLAPNASTGGEVDHVEIDDETMRAYRALNKGKTDAQIRAWHKKHAN